MAPPRKGLLRRFLSKVEFGESDECWPWTSVRMATGYGLLRDGHNRYRLAHRVSWELINGPIPKSMCICHRCDNPPCVNPDHLFLGTIADNNADMTAKGRNYVPSARLSGILNPRAKLNDAQVREIRKRVAAGELQRVVATQFGVEQTTVSAIVRRKHWLHVN